MQPRKKTGKLAGLFFLLPLLTYSTGSALVDRVVLAGTDGQQVVSQGAVLTGGALLVITNSICVIVLAALLYPVLRRHSKQLAVMYVGARILEAVLLLIGLLAVWSAVCHSEVHLSTDALREALYVRHLSYQFAMFTLGIGSIGFCRSLYQQRLVPGWLALAGVGGYGLLAIGSVLEVLGYPVGIVLAIPGGLVELTLAFVLMIRGFRY